MNGKRAHQADDDVQSFPEELEKSQKNKFFVLPLKK